MGILLAFSIRKVVITAAQELVLQHLLLPCKFELRRPIRTEALTRAKFWHFSGDFRLCCLFWSVIHWNDRDLEATRFL